MLHAAVATLLAALRPSTDLSGSSRGACRAMIVPHSLAFLALVSASALGAQSPGAGADGPARAFYATREREYAAERRAIAHAAGRVARAGGQLRLRLGAGRTVVLVDSIVDGGGHRHYLYRGRRAGLGVHVVELSYYEGGTHLVYHERTGQEETVPGPPLPSPDGRRFASASIDLEAGYDPNRLEIWRVEPSGLHRELVVDGEDAWGPDSVRWVSPSVVRFTRVVLEQPDMARRTSTRRLVRTGARWTMR